MKNKILSSALIIFITNSIINAQLLTGAAPNAALDNSNYFLDASKFQGSLPNIGKLLGFPKTDLTNFSFDLSFQTGQITARNFFDGTMVYNYATGSTVSGQGKTTNVSPGFYYFSNPGRATNINSGQWMKLGGTDFTTSETITNNSIAGKLIYSVRGTFDIPVNNTSTSFDLTLPTTGITGIYKINIYNSTTSYYTDSVYSFTLGTPTTTETPVTLVTGSPNISVVYPAGTYNYIIEYLK